MLNKTGEENDMSYRFLLLAVGLSCLMMSCAPWRDTYFDNGIDVLTQPEIKEKLGRPHSVNDPLLSDQTIWMYRYILTESDLDPWGIKTFGKQAGGVLSGPEEALREKIYCYVYALTFDKEAVLRKWSRELCQVPAPPNPFELGLSGKLSPPSRVLGKLDRPV